MAERPRSRRDEVLALIDDLDGTSVPATVQTLAERLHLSPSTVRFHLDRLARDGVVEAFPVPDQRPGRRSLRYRRVATAPSGGERNYRLLAQILAGLVAQQLPDAGIATEAAGRQWGRYLATRPRPDVRVSQEEALDQLMGRLDDLGFEPRAEGGAEIRLHNCPFRSVAESSREVACSVHLGLMRGLLEETGSGLAVEELVPFAEPRWCLVRLALPDQLPDQPPGGQQTG